MNLKLFFLLVCIALFSTSCIKYASLLSYNESPYIPTSPQAISNFKPLVIQPNDILQIQVSSTLETAVAPFNETITDSGGQASGYLVDSEGNIDMPTLGTVTLENLTLEDAKRKVQTALKPFFKKLPIVNIRLLNFKINVNGEVGNPGIFNVNNNRITMIEAITLAGDFTPYSRRDSILVIREFNDERIFAYVDFNSAEVFESPYFYLQQNDVVYVKPTTLKTTTVRDPATRILPYVSIVTSLSAIFFSILRNR